MAFFISIFTVMGGSLSPHAAMTRHGQASPFFLAKWGPPPIIGLRQEKVPPLFLEKWEISLLDGVEEILPLRKGKAHSLLTLDRGNISLFTLGMEQKEVHPFSHSEEGSPIPYMHKAGRSPAPFGGVGTSPPFKHRGNTLPHFSAEKGSPTIFRHSGGSLCFFPGRMGNPAPFRYARKSCRCLT